MWPIIKKELRENARYLLGAFVIVLFFLDMAAFDAGWTLVGVSGTVQTGRHGRTPSATRALSVS